MIPVGYGPLRDGTNLWEAVMLHPNQQQFIVANAPSGDEVCAAFVDVYNTTMSVTATAADFEFYRQVKVEAVVETVPEGFRIEANPGDRPPIFFIGSTRETAEAGFIEAWNTQMGTDFEPVEFRFSDA